MIIIFCNSAASGFKIVDALSCHPNIISHVIGSYMVLFPELDQSFYDHAIYKLIHSVILSPAIPGIEGQDSQ